MAESDNLVGPRSWAVKEIIYVSAISPLVLAALLEWFLFLVAFIYCLAKAYRKAEHWSTKVLAVVVMALFTAMRGIFLPVMAVTLPLPPQLTHYYPHPLVSFLQWFAFYTFSLLLTIPWLFCIYRLVTSSVGRTKMLKEVLNDRTAPKIMVVIPAYKEDPAVLIKALDSVVNSDYPLNCIHVFLSYDGGHIDPYLRMMKHLGIPISLNTYPPSIDVMYKGVRVTVSRFKHGGKRHCQKLTFRLIDRVYAEYNRRYGNLFMLFIDSDCNLDRLCLQNLMYDMELKPGSERNMLAMTGIITSTTQKNSFITVLQDLEYVHGQCFERSVESGCGAVTCLPGALTMLRFSAFRKMAKYYFADKAEQCEDFFDYAKCQLGEDRWLTHLLMIGAEKRYQIQMCSSAFCKTEAVQTLGSLLHQRRRWWLGYMTNEACMLTDSRLWRRYPQLCLIRFMQNTIRTTSLLFFIQVASIITTFTRFHDLPVGFIAISLGLNYALMFYFGIKLRRFKAWLYPIMFVVNPFFNWLYMVYGIFTAGQRTWGGPRADEAEADEHTTPEKAVEQARAQDDELNVQVDAFRAKAAKKESPIRPSEQTGSRLSRLPGLCGRHIANFEDTMITTACILAPLPDVPRIGLHPSCSSDSVLTDSSGSSIYLPVPMESLMNEEHRAKHHMARQAQELAARLEYIVTEPQGGQGADTQNLMRPLPHDCFDGPETQATIDRSIQVQRLQGFPLSPPEREQEPTLTQQPGVLGIMTGNSWSPQSSRGRRLLNTPRQRSLSRHAENMV